MDEYDLNKPPVNDNDAGNSPKNNFSWNNNNVSSPVSDSLGVGSIVLGAFGIITSILYIFSIPLCACAFIMSVLSRNQLGYWSKKATMGAILAIAGIMFTLIFFMMILSAIQNEEFMKYLNDYMEKSMQGYFDNYALCNGISIIFK